MRTSSRTPMRDLLALVRRFSRSSRPKRHTAEVRYPVAWVIAVHVTLHSFIHSSGFRIKYGMTPLFSLLILKAKDYSVRLKRHTAEMRYPVAWIIAVHVTLHSFIRPTGFRIKYGMTPLFSLLILKAKGHSARPKCHTAGMRTSSRTPMRDLLALARRFSRSSCPKRHTAEVRYPEVQDNGIRPNRHTAEMRYPEAMIIAVHVTLHSFIRPTGFRIKYGMTPLFSSLIS